ncbi:hypothetical protein KFK09_021122 [Dendrobium nobile]|uniref:Uncharacterized protein n=1 Tax=Dendrobium nobile TaxID=94219 RepID=A0A8T3APF7_DENNO|nr:hypothetical protein KFK09_021122 [Dendrobium nobile]
MTETASRTFLLAKTPGKFSSLASGIKSDRRPQWRWRRRRRPRFSLCVAAGDGGKRSIPATPLLQWKFDEEISSGGKPQRDPGGETLRKHIKRASSSKPAASARRLASGIWHLRLPKVVGGREPSLALKINYGQQHLPYVSSGNFFNLHPDTNEDFISLLAIKKRRRGISHKVYTKLLCGVMRKKYIFVLLSCISTAIY